MVSNAAELVAAPRTTVSQVTAVEQARAVAEVLAAVQVAQQCPRDMTRAHAEMAQACGRLALAERAFYSVPNRGTGPSVHLARELARIWGNIDYGVRELRRDDVAGESEIQAFAWDQQTNARTVRSFIVPHARMKKVNGRQTRETLVDLGDIYLNNQNVGARAVRECIYAILPGDYVTEAEDLCRRTIEKGDGQPLHERIAQSLAGFKTLGVTQQQLEARIGRPSGRWEAVDLANLAVVFRSIQRSETTVLEEFPSAAVPPPTAAALTAPAQPTEAPAQTSIPVDTEPVEKPATPAADGEQKITRPQSNKLHALMNEAGIEGRESRLAWCSDIVGREVGSSSELTRDEAARVIEQVEAFIASQQPPDGAS